MLENLHALHMYKYLGYSNKLFNYLSSSFKMVLPDITSLTCHTVKFLQKNGVLQNECIIPRSMY